MTEIKKNYTKKSIYKEMILKIIKKKYLTK